MELKKGIINVDGREFEQFVLQNKRDVETFFKVEKERVFPRLKQAFIDYVLKGETVILDTETNMAGFYSWRITGKENWNLIKLL